MMNARDGQPVKRERPPTKLKSFDVDGIADFIKSDKCKDIIVMTGAGLSTAAGIPDFRSPKTGLYANLQKYNLTSPESIFSIGFFRENPEPFFTLAKELYPGKFKPTVSHYFIRLLAEKGYLRRIYTQNIDTLERIAGVPGDKVIEAHGSFATAHCVQCHEEYSQQWVKDKVFADEIPTCTICESTVKPDIVFFGESLPKRFHESISPDFSTCDLLIVMGTSLVVHPFASLIGNVEYCCPRLLINREPAGEGGPFNRNGFEFDHEDNHRDVFLQGDCDVGCLQLADLLGWKEELEEIVSREHAKIECESQSSTSEAAAGSTPSTKSGTDDQPKAGDEATTETCKCVQGCCGLRHCSCSKTASSPSKPCASSPSKPCASSPSKPSASSPSKPSASAAAEDATTVPAAKH